MQKRLVVGIVFLVSALVVFLLGYTEITISIREDFTTNVSIFPAALLALLGLAQIVKVVRFKRSW
jgi:hypothetical protein